MRTPATRTRVVGAVLAAALAVTALLTPGSATAAHAPRAKPVADLHIDSQAYEGPRGTILASLRGRCAPGFAVAELVIDFRQGDVVTPSLLGRPFPCDGRWHRQAITSLEAFEAGPATVTARLRVVDAETGAPVRQVVETKRIYVRPAAKIVLPRHGTLERDGALRLVVRARCDAPWVLQEFLIHATQDQRSATTSATIPCDGIVRPVVVRLDPGSGAFRRGPVLVDASITLLDPEFFDPVTQVTASRSVQAR